MSQERYQQLWQKARQLLIEANDQDSSAIRTNSFQSKQDLILWLKKVYVTYGQIANQLCEVNDNIRDPTIADQSRRLLDTTLSRLLQIKEELTAAEGDLYSDLNEVLTERATTAYDAQLRIPMYFQREREEVIEARKNLLEEVKLKIQEEEKEDVEEIQDNLDIYSYDYYYEPSFVEDKIPEPRRTNESFVEVKKPVDPSQVKALELITKCLQACSKKEEYLRFLSAVPSPSNQAEIMAKDKEAAEESFNLMNKQKARMEAERARLKKKIIHRFGDQIKEELTDEIRAWYTEFYNVCGEFPKFPPKTPAYALGQKLGIPKGVGKEFLDEHFPETSDGCPKKPVSLELARVPQYGGTALIQSGNWINAEEYLLIRDGLKAKPKKERKEPFERKPAKSKKNPETFEYSLKPTECLSVMKYIEEEIRSTERHAKFSEDLEEELKSTVCAEVNLEIRQEVDTQMQQELAKLAKKTGIKQKRGKAKKLKGKKVQQYTMDMVKDLVKNGILHEGSGSKLRDYRGERRIVNSSPRDIIDQLLAYAVLPLGSSTVHQLAPLTRSICLIGPEHSAKSFLADAIVTEVGATLFEISPDHLKEQYQDPEELKTLAKSISLVARQLQPSIILVKNVEKVFYSKVPKAEKATKPQRLKSVLKKIIKDINPDTQILVVGTTSFPWLAKKKPLFSTFNKIIPLPNLSYGTYTEEWKTYFKVASIPLNHIPFANIAARRNWGPHGGTTEFNNILSAADADRKDDKEILGKVLLDMRTPKDNFTKFFASKPQSKKKKKT